MSICHSGLSNKVSGKALGIEVSTSHPLVRLANALPWEELGALVIADLKSTTAKQQWWRGRPLRLRIHLGVYLLQQLFNKTDRQIEYDVKDNAAYQLFCGQTIVKKWHSPDHTKIEEFRSRLSPETQRQCANHLAVVATRLNFANAAQMDIDSTVQEANISYPSDMNLLGKLSVKAMRVRDYVTEKISGLKESLPAIDVKSIKSKIRNIFFNKKATPEEKRSKQRDLWNRVCAEIKPTLRFCEQLSADVLKEIKSWGIRRIALQIKTFAKQYLIDVASFIRHGKIRVGKTLAFHAQEISCFNKNKPDRRLQFGRNFQLGRLGGNFLIVGACETVRQEDKASVKPILALHQNLFGETVLESATADKGYYAKKNQQAFKEAGVKEIGLQKPRQKNTIEVEIVSEALVNRRAGIEPLIGHAKQKGQLGKSRMKYDETTKAAGYTAILGFNGRQLIRNLNSATSLHY